MQTNVLKYIPVLDQENPNVSALTNAQKEQVEFFNATAYYTAGQVGSNLNDDRQARLIAISERFRFIMARSTMLVQRSLKEEYFGIMHYVENFNVIVNMLIPFIAVGSNHYEFSEDTHLALDKEDIPNLMSLYTYELIQLSMLIHN